MCVCFIYLSVCVISRVCVCVCVGGGGIQRREGGPVLVPSVRRAGANKEHGIMNGTLICFSLARSS